jgi:hypothetical protein
MEYASSVGVSKRRVGVWGLEVGELYVKRRRRLGVVGVPLAEIGIGRVGELGRRGEGGVTSECRIELNMALACSESTSQ